MRIILHAGLHKSGTTSLQASWNAAYADHPDVCYPRRGGGRPPGHHDLVRPLLTAFTERRDVDLVTASLASSLRGGPRGASMADVVTQARDRGVATLLLSSEDLDRATTADRPVLEAVFGAEDVTLVVTATRPVHRWCSGWQTLVKHGLADYPREAERHLLDFAALRADRLRELVGLVPATRRVVRLVRSSPPEEELAADLAGALGLPDPSRAAGHGTRNTSLGTDAEVVLRINRADLALGTGKAGRQLLEELRGEGFTYRDAPQLASHYELPETVAEGARAEQAWLRAPGDVEVLDPHGLLDDWSNTEVPEWYAEISRREAVVPRLEEALAAEGRETQLWRVRQERAAYRRRLERLERLERPERPERPERDSATQGRQVKPAGPLVMGVVNVTPDSFSDGGRWATTQAAIAHGRELLADGADILDVGGESTRPGATRPLVEEELSRVVPVIAELAAAGAVVSVDTMRATVAEQALAAGAQIVNDVSGGLADADVLGVVRDADATYVAMHWRAHADHMLDFATYDNPGGVVAAVRDELAARVEAVLDAGVPPERLVLDPGLGFAKHGVHNWQLLAHLDAVKALGYPVLVGASRKSFLGTLLPGPDGAPRPVDDREAASTALSLLVAREGVWGIRVHDVRSTCDALAVWRALETAREEDGETLSHD